MLKRSQQQHNIDSLVDKLYMSTGMIPGSDIIWTNMDLAVMFDKPIS